MTGASSDPEKPTESRLEVHTAEAVVVQAEDERFEWGEIMRGQYTSFRLSNACSKAYAAKGVKDPQVWMTALSYMGIIISLYSFSLFL